MLFIVRNEEAEIEWRQIKKEISKREINQNFTLRLFYTVQEYLIFLGTVFFIFLISIIINYFQYLEFSRFSTYKGDFIIIDQYQKTPNTIFKLQADNGFFFYTSSRYKYKNLLGLRVQAEIIIPEKFNFINFLKGSYLILSALSIIDNCDREMRFELSNKLNEIHANKKIADLYSALLFATPIRGELRNDLTRLGINHLAVLSGFHVSLVVIFSTFLFYIIYMFFHGKFFPYRNRIKDSLIVGIVIALIYNLFLQSPPPFLRSIFMFIIGFVLFDRNVSRGKFDTLLITIIILIAFDPRLFFSVSFWFSVAGVFYILLYMSLFKFGIIIDLIVINFFVFFAMIPIIHLFFNDFYIMQLLSPIWTILFEFIYPIMVIVHLLGIGDIFDEILINFLSLNFWGHYQFYFSNIETIIFILLSIILAIWSEIKNKKT